MTALIVPHRFRGPTESGNGGYVCGRIAALASRPVTVRLMSPPPLERELEVLESEDGTLSVMDGGNVVATARPGEVGALEPPPPPTPSETAAAASRYAGFARHPAPECFVCGPKRDPGDALRLFCGALDAADAVAGPWVPHASLDAGDGSVAVEFVWSALDCPGFLAAAPDMRWMLLGEMTASVERRVRVGEPCTVVGWLIASSGRKHETGTALYGAQGDLCGIARAIWIEPRNAASG